MPRRIDLVSGNRLVNDLTAKEPPTDRFSRPFSNLLALPDFFRGMPAYVILKLSDSFPSYHDYSDIDILCADREAVLAHLRAVGEAYGCRGFKLQEERHDGHLHLDFYAPEGKRLNFRFDLLESLDAYRKLSVTPEFAAAILAGGVTKVQNDVEVHVPAIPHDLALRFLEFIEWKDERPDKVKHWEYIQKTGRFDFVEVVNRFTDLQIDLKQNVGDVQLTWVRRSSSNLPLGAPETVHGRVTETMRMADLMRRAEADFNARRYAEAAEHYCAAIRIDSDAIPALQRLGECLVELHDVASARWCFARVCALEPRNEVAAQAGDRLAAAHSGEPAACDSAA